ncbi:MAG: PSD1 and planctomycete cytochrome C domain-containing protein [Limisphaerales bacterium]
MKNSIATLLTLLAALAAANGAAVAAGAAARFTPEQLDFFEKKIRPLLAERCYQCHSAQAEKLKGGLLLDSREGALKGGDDGPVILPGHPDKSRLIEAVGYANVDLQMPPKTRLSEEQIAALTAWVKLGAPWPEHSSEPIAAKQSAFDLGQRRRAHWAWQPIGTPRPPAVEDNRWIGAPIDNFILAKLEANRLRPAPPADKRTLIRRASFDLIGLPPSAQEVEAFVRDRSPDAFAKLVDRLLASPRFGERWARHWLDLTRYAETMGHEFDYPILNAWRYRDYVIRAFNEDVPYDQFVVEQVAGDLLARPRTDPSGHFNESVLGTMFYWLGQQVHSPVDVERNQADLIDNQIDVLTKTFLGLTVACARCHDHKFDAITTQDYYALYGILQSSRYRQAALGPADQIAPRRVQLTGLKEEIRRDLGGAWSKPARQISQNLLAAREVILATDTRAGADQRRSRIEHVAAKYRLSAEVLRRWVEALQSDQIRQVDHPLYAWAKLALSEDAAPVARFSADWQAMIESREKAREQTNGADQRYHPFAGVAGPGFGDWFADGEAFARRQTQPGDFLVGDGPAHPVGGWLRAGIAHSGLLSRRFEGALRSPTFTIQKAYIHIRAAGRDSRINVVVDGLTLIRDPIYGGLKRGLNNDQFQWLTIDVSMWKGDRAYLELADSAAPDPAGGAQGANGYLAVERVEFSDQKTPPALNDGPTALALLGAARLNSVRDLARRYQRAASDAVESWQRNRLTASAVGDAQMKWLAWLEQNQLLADAPPGAVPSRPGRLAGLLRQYHEVETSIPQPVLVAAMTDGTGEDAPVLIRGNPKSRGPLVPRRFLEAIAGEHQPPIARRSGRLELTRRLVDPANPLLARVRVNHVWEHLFGQGIVPTPDNFGVLGEPPSHPELLDWLADWYRKEGWSTKKLIRLMMLSSTYQMSSRPDDPVAEEKDPTDAWLHRMPVRRLEGEAIRDAILSVSGRLDPAMFGPSVPVHLTPFMDGRGRPGVNGPLDGDGRRSIYLEVRRNFLSPMMLAFDTPIPYTTVARRSVSNVPAQALILMNDAFVVQAAEFWAHRLLAETNRGDAQRIDELFETALGRPPTNSERADALAFLNAQAGGYRRVSQSASDPAKVWADLCQVFFNVKEFIFVH